MIDFQIYVKQNPIWTGAVCFIIYAGIFFLSHLPSSRMSKVKDAILFVIIDAGNKRSLL